MLGGTKAGSGLDWGGSSAKAICLMMATTTARIDVGKQRGHVTSSFTSTSLSNGNSSTDSHCNPSTICNRDVNMLYICSCCHDLQENDPGTFLSPHYVSAACYYFLNSECCMPLSVSRETEARETEWE